MATCPKCEGKGRVECPVCNGRGTRGNFLDAQCGGKGSLLCPKCIGSGVVSNPRARDDDSIQPEISDDEAGYLDDTSDLGDS
jgi:hypothetical protein